MNLLDAARLDYQKARETYATAVHVRYVVGDTTESYEHRLRQAREDLLKASEAYNLVLRSEGEF